jgi:guanylate kinase
MPSGTSRWFDGVVLVIDVQGAQSAGACVQGPRFSSCADRSPCSEQRCARSQQDGETEIQRRLAVAREEVAAYCEYDFVVVNDELTAAVDRLRSIVSAARARLKRMTGVAETIVRTFS